MNSSPSGNPASLAASIFSFESFLSSASLHMIYNIMIVVQAPPIHLGVWSMAMAAFCYYDGGSPSVVWCRARASASVAS